MPDGEHSGAPPRAPLSAAEGTLADTLARERRRLVARVARRLGLAELALAEDAVQVATLRALQHWPTAGVPVAPAAWLNRVALNEAIDQLRRRAREVPWPDDDAAAHADAPPVAAAAAPAGLAPRASWASAESAASGASRASGASAAPQESAKPAASWLAAPAAPAGRFAGELDDDELALLFAACHPRLPLATQVALALRVVTDLELALLAEGLFTTEAALAQRLARARGQLAGEVPALPAGHELPPRREAVMTALALMFRCGLRGPAGGRDLRVLCWEAIRLSRALAAHPAAAHADADALAATLLLHGARLTGRWDDAGEIVPLPGQPRDRWDAGMVRMGVAHLGAAQRGQRLSRWHVLAGIAAEHAGAPDHDRTDWAAIVRYYEMLLVLDPTAAPRLGHAIALAEAGAPQQACSLLQALAPQVPPGLRPHALAALARACERCGRPAEARDWLAQAVAAAPPGADARLLARRLAGTEAAPQHAR